MHSYAFSPDGSKMYLGNDGGVMSTTTVTSDPTTFEWADLNQDLAITEFYPGFSANPSNYQQFLVAGSQDNGTQIYSGNLTWTPVACGDGGWSIVDSQTPSTVYTSCNGIAILKSVAGGAAGTFSLAQNGVNTSDRVSFIPPFVADPSNTQVLYFGTYRVYQSSNGASTWSAISPDLTNGGVVTSIAVSPTDSNTVYVGTSDSLVQVSSGASVGVGATWQNISSGLPPRYVTQVAVSPKNPATAYVTFSGFSGFADTLGHVFETTDQGLTWSDISGNLPNIPVNDIAVDPDVPRTLYIGTDVGVFSSNDGGQHWSPLGVGLPNVVVNGVKLHEATRSLIAATYGRSMWALSAPIPGVSAALSSSNLNFAGQVVGNKSATQAVTISNTGNVSLTITNVTVAGPNSADFSVEPNGTTCSATAPIAAGSNCVVTVGFDPGAAGSRSGTLNIFDNAANSPQTVALSGTGEDFSLGVASGSSMSATVTAGQSATYTLNMTPQGGFNQATTLSCTGAPLQASCYISPSSVTFDGLTPATATVTVTTMAHTMALPMYRGPLMPSTEPGVVLSLAYLFALLIIVILYAAAQAQLRTEKFRIWLVPASIILCVLLWAGCGGGAGNGAVGGNNVGTPAGAYTLSISANSGALSHRISLTLTVN